MEKNQGGERRRNRPSLGKIRTPKTDDEEVCLIKNMNKAKKSDIEARVKDAFTYVKPYI